MSREVSVEAARDRGTAGDDDDGRVDLAIGRAGANRLPASGMPSVAEMEIGKPATGSAEAPLVSAEAWAAWLMGADVLTGEAGDS